MPRRCSRRQPDPGAVTPELGGLLDEVARGPRSSHQPGSGTRTLAAYAQWAERSGGQSAAFAGEQGWSPERRFARVFERLVAARASTAARGTSCWCRSAGSASMTCAQSRCSWGQREGSAAARTRRRSPRSACSGSAIRCCSTAAPLTLAEAAGVPLEALDLALFNWSRPVGAGGRRSASGRRACRTPESQAAALAL